MIRLKLIEFYEVVLFLAILIVFSSSCKAKDPVLLDYVGTWVAVEYRATPDGFSWFKNNWTFTETTFSELMQIQLSTDKWVDYSSMKGSMTVNGKLMNFSITEVGYPSFDALTGLPTGEIKRYGVGSDIFEHYLLDIENSIKVNSEWSVSGNYLTNKTDYNFDGDYLDSGETTVYTRQ